MTSDFYYLSLRDVELICLHVVKELMNFDEPLPDFSTRYPNKLESILSLPKSGFGDEEFYPDIYTKAACYLYFIIKDHPFINGNKRIAIVTTYVFLRINGVKLKASTKRIYDFAIEVSQLSSDHEKEFKKVTEFIKANT